MQDGGEMEFERIIEAETAVLSGIVPIDSSDQRLQVVFRNLEHLSTRVPPEVWTLEARAIVEQAMMCRQAQAVLTEDLLVDHIQRQDFTPDQIVTTQEMFIRAKRSDITEGKFRIVVDLFMKEQQVRLTQLVLADAFKITEPKGMMVGKDVVKGVESAKEYLMHKLFQLDSLFLTDVPHGSVRDDGDEVWREYEERRDRPDSFRGVLTGLSAVDELTNGAFPGELWLLAAFAGQGKTNTLINWIHNAAVHQGKNVVVAVNEMLYRQYRVRLFIRHSCEKMFGINSGIPYVRYKLGQLNPEQENAFKAVIHDFKFNPKYGRIEVFQIPKGAGLDFVASRLASYQAIFNVDVLYIDYLQLVGGGNKWQAAREYLRSLLLDTKQLAVSFDRGRGIPIVTPWQIKRDAYEAALESGKYTLDCLAESAEAERSSDFVMWLLRRSQDLDNKSLQAGIIKYRDGIVDKPFSLFEDFSSYYVGNMTNEAAGLSLLIDADGKELI